VAAFVAAGALVSACDASTDPDEESAGSSTSDDVALRDAPGVGTCWRIPDDAITDPDYWFDDSPQVRCTEPHNSETAFVFPLDEPTVERAKGLADACWDSARRYVDVNLDHWVPWASLGLLPSRQQVANGASFFRCEVAVPANLAITEFTLHTYSVEGVATTRADELLPCLDESPDMRRQPFVSCAKPHRYEATGQLASLIVDAYPSPKVLRSEAVQCRDGLPRHQDTPKHAVTVAWDPPERFDGGQLAGVCFVYRQDRSLLPARK
jgi:hypothetical protein